MLQKQTDSLIALIHQSQSVIFLFNDIQHQIKKSVTPHETLPAILAQLDLYKKLVLSPAQIIELQSIANDPQYGLQHAFLYELPTGIITKELKEDFLTQLQETIKKKVHEAVETKVKNLVGTHSADSTADQENNVLESYERLISSCKTEILTFNNNAEKILGQDNFQTSNAKLVGFATTDDGSINIAGIVKALQETVKNYPNKVEGTQDNIAFQEAKNLISLIDSLQKKFLEFRAELETFKPQAFKPLIQKYSTVESNPIYQVATALEELPKLKRLLEERCPAKMKEASVNATHNITSAVSLTGGAVTKLLLNNTPIEERNAVKLALQLLEQAKRSGVNGNPKTLFFVGDSQKDELESAWTKLDEWVKDSNRNKFPTQNDLQRILRTFALATASSSTTFSASHR